MSKDITVNQYASRCDVVPSTVRHWIKYGKLNATLITIGSRKYWMIPDDQPRPVKTHATPTWLPNYKAKEMQ